MDCIVSTKEELKAAVEAKIEEIIIEKDLALQLKKTKKVANMSAVALAALVASVTLAPATGGLTLGAAASAAALSGFEIATIIFVSLLGVGAVLAIWKDYDEIEMDHGRIKIKRKSGKSDQNDPDETPDTGSNA